MRGWLKRAELLLQQPVNTWFTLWRGKQLTSSLKLHHTLQCSLAFRDLRQNWSSVLSTKRSVSGRKGLSSAWSKGCLLRAWLVSAAPENPPLVTKLEPMWEKNFPVFNSGSNPGLLHPLPSSAHPVLSSSARHDTLLLQYMYNCIFYGRPPFQQRNSSIPGAFTICVWNGRFCFPAINLSTGRGLKCIDKCNISTWLWALSWAAKFDGLAKTCKNWQWLRKTDFKTWQLLLARMGEFSQGPLSLRRTPCSRQKNNPYFHFLFQLT